MQTASYSRRMKTDQPGLIGERVRVEIVAEDAGKAIRREPTLILLVIVAFCSIYSTWLPIRSVPASDFYQFWVVGQELAHGQPGDIYTDRERERIGRHYLDQARIAGEPTELRAARQRVVLETFSTPFLYTLFGSLSSGEYERDLSTFRAFSLAFVVLSVAVLCRLLGYGVASTIVAITLFASWFAPARSDWLVGNVNSLQLGLLTLFLGLSCRFPTKAGYLAGGLLLGLGVMFKPNSVLVVGLLLVAWLVRRRHEKLVLASVGIASGALAAFVWSSAAFGGPSIWRSWSSALSALPDDIITVELGNYAPARLLSDWAQVDASLVIASVCAGLALAAVGRGLWGAVPEEPGDRAGFEDICVVALAGLMTLLSSPLSWLHYFVSAVPMLLVVLRPAAPGFHRDGAWWIIARGAALVALLAVMMRPLVILELGDDHSRAIFLCVGTALLFGLGLRELHAFRPAPSVAREEA